MAVHLGSARLMTQDKSAIAANVPDVRHLRMSKTDIDTRDRSKSALVLSLHDCEFRDPVIRSHVSFAGDYNEYQGCFYSPHACVPQQ